MQNTQRPTSASGRALARTTSDDYTGMYSSDEKMGIDSDVVFNFRCYPKLSQFVPKISPNIIGISTGML